MTTVSIRLAERRHLPDIPKIELAGAAMFSETDLPQTVRHRVTPTSCLEEARSAQRLWVAEDDEKVVGFAAASIVDDSAYVDEIDVIPEFGRRGVGTRLVATVADWARAENFPDLTLITFSHLPWNAPFYEKLGFERMDSAEHGMELTGLIEEERRIGIDTANRVAMRLNL